MKHRYLVPVLSISFAFGFNSFLGAQIPFANKTNLLPTVSLSSGNSIGVCDMNNDGKDDIVRADQNTNMTIDYQQAPNGNFTESVFTNYIDDPWAMCVADVNNDGFNDVMWGDDGVYVYVWNGATYSGGNITASTNAGYIFVQGSNFADINNDGKVDVFSCNDDMMPHIYLGNGSNGWTFNQGIMPLATVPASDNSGNYASIWTDINADGLIDLMITHCRQGVTNASDPRRIDQIFLNNGNGTYTQDVTNSSGLRDGAEGWSTAWGDVDNDGDMDAFVLNYDVNSTLMINNGNGVFTNAMAGSGIASTTSIFGENATFQDFNNDGFVDLFISGDTHLLYINNGNGTFTLNQNFDPSNTITAHAVGDLNGDGFLDIYASYCYIYQSPSGIDDKVWMNVSPDSGNVNHWIKFNLQGVQSTRNALGAIVKIYGPWGVQVREVRSGEGYGIQNSFTCHFGLGANTSIDSVIVQWPSGIVDELGTVPANQTIHLLEGSNPASVNPLALSPMTISVSPNPVTDQAVIRLDHFSQYGLNNLSLNVYDMNGKLIYAEAELQNSIIVLDRNLLSSGMYFVEVTDKGKRLASEKMMVN